MSQIPKPSIPSAQLFFGAFVSWPASSGGPKTSTSGQDQRMISTTCCLVGEGNIGGTTWRTLPHTIMVQCRIGFHDYRRKTKHGWEIGEKERLKLNCHTKAAYEEIPQPFTTNNLIPLFLYTFMGLFVINILFFCRYHPLKSWGPTQNTTPKMPEPSKHDVLLSLSLFTSNLFKWLGDRGFISCTVVHQLTCDEAYEGIQILKGLFQTAKNWWESESISN